MAADGHVVDATYGCGAHSDTLLPSGAGSPQFDAYDDGAVEVVERAVADTETEAESESRPEPEAAAEVTEAEESASTS